MKLIIRDYLASLREREELDAVLPDLLSELGFTVYSRPGRGTTQYGVDVAAVGVDDDGEKKVFLFSIKRGDLTRAEWDAPLQGLRTSLNEIRDVYITSRIPERYKSLRIVVCLCFGGDMREQVQPMVHGYMKENTTGRVSYDEWNGDKIAGLIERGVLREKAMPEDLRSSFRKAVAMVDEPDVAFHHFDQLVAELVKRGEVSRRARVRSARQMYVCLWILFVWARDAKNVESAYLASEVVVLRIWHLIRPLLGTRTDDLLALDRVLGQAIHLHLLISSAYLEPKIIPSTRHRHATSMAVDSRSSVDVNLSLFEVLGRLSLYGLWLGWIASKGSTNLEPMTVITDSMVGLISNNPALSSPLRDDHAIDICLATLLSLHSGVHQEDIGNWLHNVVDRIDFAYRTNGAYPCVFGDYGRLIEHPRDTSEAYLKEATSGSVLLPLLAAWAAGIGDEVSVTKLVDLKATRLKHCTLQAWVPDTKSDDEIYKGGRDHGVALTDLPLVGDGRSLIDALVADCKQHPALSAMSAVRCQMWLLVLVACRHYRLPVPAHFWISALTTEPKVA